MSNKSTDIFFSAILLFTGIAVMSPDRARADLYDVPRVKLVENKSYSLHDEIAAQLSYLPMDPYIKYVGAGLAYTHYFSEFTGWEVVNGQYLYGINAGLKKDLIENFNQDGLMESKLPPALNFLATSNLVFTPIYTKNLLFNSNVVFSQFSFVGGGGFAGFEDGLKNCIDLGVVLRYFLGPNNSLKLDFRDYIFLSSVAKNNLTLIAAYTFSFGGSSSKDHNGEQ